MFKLIGFVLPLGLDTFAVAFAVLGTGLSTFQRLRATILFMAFEAGMPLVGLAIGQNRWRARWVTPPNTSHRLLHEWTGAGRRHRYRPDSDERIREASERLAAVALIGLARFLLAEPPASFMYRG